MKVRELKRGDYFKRKENAARVLVRGEYVREIKKFSCYYFDDVNREIFLSGNTEIFTDFEF